MAANDRGPLDQNGAPFDENEDLFDFPIIEMTLEGLQERTPGSTDRPRMEVMQPAPAPALPKAPVAPQAAPTLSTVTPASVVFEPKTVPVASPISAALPPASMSAAPTPVVMPVAHVVEDHIEPPLDTPFAPTTRSPRARLVRVALIFLIALNATGFWYVWRTHSAFGAGLDDLSAKIDGAALRLERARRDAVDRTISATPQTGPSLEAIDALERTAIELAEDEIRVGDYGAARRRLSRLLVRAERMSPGLRAEIEPRAAYLIAHSYHDEALARAGTPR